MVRMRCVDAAAPLLNVTDIEYSPIYIHTHTQTHTHTSTHIHTQAHTYSSNLYAHLRTACSQILKKMQQLFDGFFEEQSYESALACVMTFAHVLPSCGPHFREECACSFFHFTTPATHMLQTSCRKYFTSRWRTALTSTSFVLSGRTWLALCWRLTDLARGQISASFYFRS